MWTVCVSCPQIQDVAEQGVMFVGFLQQPGGGPCFLGHWDPEELSSLHSSPSPIHRHPVSTNTTPTDPTEPHPSGVEPRALDDESGVCNTLAVVPRHADCSSMKLAPSSEDAEELDKGRIKEPLESTNQSERHCRSGVHPFQCYQNPADAQGSQTHPGPLETPRGVRQQQCELPDGSKCTEEGKERRASSSDSCLSSPDLERSRDETSDERSSGTTHNNNNHILRLKSSEKDKNLGSPAARARKDFPFDKYWDFTTAANGLFGCVCAGMQLFALYNHTAELNTTLRFYSLRVPLQVQKEGGLITDIDAHWLDHMTQHFSSGAHLVDGFFYVGEDNGTCLSYDHPVMCHVLNMLIRIFRAHRKRDGTNQ